MDLKPEYIKVGDVIKATNDWDSARTGPVVRLALSVDGEPGFRIKAQEHGGAEITVLNSMRTYSGGIEGEPQVGDIIIGSPTGLRCVLRALVTSVRSTGLDAQTVETLDNSAGYRNTDGAFSYRKSEVTIVQRPEPKASAQTLDHGYPTPHHLKAAIWDLARTKYQSGEWCTDVNKVLDRLTVPHVTDAATDRLQAYADELCDKVQGLWSNDLGISRSEFEAALAQLGIEPKPQTKRVQLELEVPAHLTLGDVQAMIHSASPNTIVRHNSEVTP